MPKDNQYPLWLFATDTGKPEDWPGNSRKKSTGFVEKTINGMARVLRDEFFSQHLATQPGLLQNLDPRVKVITTAILIFLTALLRHAIVLLLLNMWILWVAYLSRVPLGIFFRRTWLFIPFFAGLIVLPTIFNFIRPGDPWLILLNFGHVLHLGPITLPQELAITRQGAAGALTLVLRVGACVSLAALLTITTKWHALLKALSVLLIPQIFIMVVEMTYRYIFILLQITIDAFMARKSRTVGRGSIREKQRFVSTAMANLWGKSYAMNEEIYAAMLSRGYTGKVRDLSRLKMGSADLLWTGLVVLFAILFYGGDHLIGS